MSSVTYAAVAREAYPSMAQIAVEVYPSLAVVEIEAGYRPRPRRESNPKEQK